MFLRDFYWTSLAIVHITHGASLETPARLSNISRRQNNGPTCLDPDVIQSASALTGQEDGTDGIKEGQAPSETDEANFINFCAGQQPTNGMQITTGSCNPISMGKIPAADNMISAIIANPQHGDQLPADTTFNISVQTTHLRAGFFVNPTTNYYTAPQDLDENGDIIGHCHVTVQEIGDLKSTTPPNPSTFAFFKGIDDDGNGQGLLFATVDGGLPVGVYRVCTMIAAQNHQPVNMPVAQRGAQDDCTKFEVRPSNNPSNSPSQNRPNAAATLFSPAFCAPRLGPRSRDSSVGKDVYFITNESQNSVAAIPIAADGLLANGGTFTATGGAGANGIDGATGEDAIPDPLFSQSALTLVGENIFAVNAGSNTLSMFAIDPNDPTNLCLVGQPVALPGEFPVTVSASARNALVCVGMTGTVAGVSCAPFSSSLGLGQMDTLRPFDIQQSTPPVGPTNTVSQVFFSDDETMLFTTVKGDPAVNNTGFLSGFPVVGATGQGVNIVSTVEARSSPGGTAVLFGSLPIPGTNSIFATDASFGAAVLDVNGGVAALAAQQALDGQVATCWVTISSSTNSAFVTDVGVNRVVEMSLDDASTIGELDLSVTGAPGLIDLRAAGDFVYVLSPGNATFGSAISVLDITGGQGSARLVQNFDLAGLAGPTSMGMAVLA